MLLVPFFCVQSILLLLKPALAVPASVDSPSLSLHGDPPKPPTLILNSNITDLAANTTLTLWPRDPFMIPITPLAFTWIWIGNIGFPGYPKQKSVLLAIIASQLVIYTSQPPGSSPHPFTNSRQDVTFAMHYEEGEKLDMELAVSGLKVFQRKVQEWGAQELEFNFGREGDRLARLSVVLGNGLGGRMEEF